MGFPAKMASQISVVEMRVSYSFGRSRDFAGIRHSFGREGRSEGRKGRWKGSGMRGYVVICG